MSSHYTEQINWVEIWIPAHNEEHVISQTLHSIQKTTRELEKITIGVACNGCTDNTVNLVQKENVKLLELPAIGKWKTIEHIILQSKSEWIGFVDAGTIWDPLLLNGELKQWFNDSNLVGFTLEYSLPKMGLLEKLYWNIESFFKSFEEKMGGLVTVSGFSMFFKRTELTNAIQFLKTEFGEVSWLNDDVIIPLTLRFLYPSKKIKIFRNSLQPSLSFIDLGLSDGKNEKNRRVRMMRGNLQWIRRFVPLFFRLNYFSMNRLLILVLISRKAVKIIWAYLFTLALLIFCMNISWFAILTPLLLLLTPRFLNQFLYAFSASLKAPFELCKKETSEKLW
jgi:cellulose synthase/poly-beta-1,6-N-acetylglucosamine synthase-like glycosyltransferase